MEQTADDLAPSTGVQPLLRRFEIKGVRRLTANSWPPHRKPSMSELLDKRGLYRRSIATQAIHDLSSRSIRCAVVLLKSMRQTYPLLACHSVLHIRHKGTLNPVFPPFLVDRLYGGAVQKGRKP